MSISAMSNVAYVRRADVKPLNAAPKTLNEIAQATGGTPESKNAVTSALNVIVTYIPTEILALYVAVLAALEKPDTLPGRPQWAAFYFFLLLTPVVVWLAYAAKVKTADRPLPLAPRKWPMWEMFSATVAYVAWAFALPKSPFLNEDWYSPALSGVIVLVISTFLGLLAPVVQRPLPP